MLTRRKFCACMGCDHCGCVLDISKGVVLQHDFSLDGKERKAVVIVRVWCELGDVERSSRQLRSTAIGSRISVPEDSVPISHCLFSRACGATPAAGLRQSLCRLALLVLSRVRFLVLLRCRPPRSDAFARGLYAHCVFRDLLRAVGRCALALGRICVVQWCIGEKDECCRS